MRKRKVISIIFGAVLLLCACSSKESDVTRLINAQIEAEAGQSKEAQQSKDLVQDTKAERETQMTGVPAAEQGLPVIPEVSDSIPEVEETVRPADPDVDIDLTAMSSTMVYAEVYNMLLYPERYVGKTVKASGEYYASYWEETDTYYHYVVIADAAACCEQGLEFIWDEGAHSYPADYPVDYTPVEIIGTFGMYEEGGYDYSYLATDGITVH